MLSISASEVQQPHTHSAYPRYPAFLTDDNSSTISSSKDNCNIANMPHRLPDPESLVAGVPSTNPTLSLKMGSTPIMSDVSQALEIARESPYGASDPTIHKILDHAITHIWNKVQSKPDEYIMTRDEFSVFNYFQYRFVGNKTAMAARARYWNNTKA